MSDPTPGTTGGTPPPPQAKPKKSEEARRRREPKQNRRVVVMLGIAGVLFAGLVVWITSQPIPYVTHREILDLAITIEATKNSEEMLRHFDPRLFEGLPAEAKEMVTKPRDDANVLYTFLTVADERTKRPRLLFRLHQRSPSKTPGVGATTTVFDYQEMVADRLDGVVKVVDVRSLAGGDMWLSAWRGAAAAPNPALLAAVQSKKQAEVVAAFQALPQDERAALPARIALLRAMDTHDADGFLALSREVWTWYPPNLAPAFRVLFDAQTATPPIRGQLRDDVRAAIGRIQVRIPDDAWLGAFARAMLTTPPEDPK